MSSTTAAPFPPPGGYIRAVRESAHALRVASGVAVRPAAIAGLLAAPAFAASFPRLARAHGVALPLAFPSPLAELNVLAVLALANAGSGYRAPLHAHTGRGAWDAVRGFVLAVYISGEGDVLSARALRGMTAQRVAELMRVPTHVERPHAELPGVVVGEVGGPLYDLAALLAGVLSETGALLEAQGYPDLGSFVLEALREGERVARAHGDAGGVDADVVLEKLVRAIPGFRDMSVVGGKPVYVFKKALFLLHAIALRFGGGDPPAVPVPATAALPVFADNVLPSMLVHLGIIDVSGATSGSLAKAFSGPDNVDGLLQLPAAGAGARVQEPIREGPVLSQDDAYILRASAIDACEQIVGEAHKATGLGSEWLRNMTLPELDAWLWAGAKDRADYRELERFVVRDTVFF